jgi:type II secretory pathway pseudopilin PulG
MLMRERQSCRGYTPEWLREDAGLTYLGVLILTAMLTASIAAAGILWYVAQQRQREHDLLFIGNQFRLAIGRYYLNQSGPQKEYPKRLEDLLRDPRHPGSIRYLRKLYVDPMTGSTDWGLLKTPDGSILGVYSKSTRKPIKNAMFRPVDRHLERKAKYSEWKFVYLPGQSLGGSAPSQVGGPTPFGNAVPDLEQLVAQPPQPGRFGDPLPAAMEGPAQAEMLNDAR